MEERWALACGCAGCAHAGCANVDCGDELEVACRSSTGSHCTPDMNNIAGVVGHGPSIPSQSQEGVRQIVM